MKKRLKLMALPLAAAIFAASLAGCQSNNSAQNASSTSGNAGSASTNSSDNGNAQTAQKDPVKLNINLFGDDNTHYRNVDPVIKEFEKQTKDTLNTTLNISFTPPVDYAAKSQLWLSSGEPIDLMYASTGNGMEKFVQDGAFADLSKYFNNPEYPGLQQAFSEQYVNDNKLYGKSYVIPITNSFMDMEGVWYRKDLLDKYGMSEINSYDDLYNFLDKVSQNEKDMQPFGNYGTYAFFKMFTDINAQQLEGKVFPFTGGANPKLNYILVQLADDEKSVAGVAAYGDPDSEWANINPQYGKEYILNEFKQAQRFNKFIPADALSNTAGTGKQVAAGFITLSNFQSQEAKVKSQVANAELDFWPIFKNNQEMIPHSQSTDGKAWNFLAIPASSKNIDRTMEFLDWIFSSQQNNDLFTYGIEGTNWEAVGDDQWKLPDGVDAAQNYLFPGYQLTWNPTLNRIPAGLPDKLQQYYQFEFNPDSYQKNALAGFIFEQEPVKNEIAKCNTVIANYLPFLLSGFGDVNENLSKMNADLKDAGVEKIKDELTKQINAFLAQKN
ncbi:ABC transporter substrate-binding protein [Paenibacillus macerans]|uniref:ABC transporter substrate-binding protein n=1 Tax=Paenibacillus macerans TaxID=44252 RepID=UPI003D31ED16